MLKANYRGYIMKKILIILVSILIVCAGCNIEPSQNSPGITVSPTAANTPEPTPTVTVTTEPTPTATATPDPTPSMTVTPDPTPIPIIENYKLSGDSIILRSGLKISDLESYFEYTGSELLQKLGDQFEIVPAGVEGTWDGYYYGKLGITLVFNDYDYSLDEAPLMWIGCDVDKLELNGLTQDMSLYQIEERIGEGKIKKDVVEEGVDEYAYYLTYKIGKIILTFCSYSKDGSDDQGYWVSIDYNYDL